MFSKGLEDTHHDGLCFRSLFATASSRHFSSDDKRTNTTLGEIISERDVRMKKSRDQVLILIADASLDF